MATRRASKLAIFLVLGALVASGCNQSSNAAPQTREQQLNGVLTHLVHDPNASSDAKNLAVNASEKVHNDQQVMDLQSGR